MQKFIIAAAAVMLFMFGLVVHFGNAEIKQKGYHQTAAAAMAIVTEATSAQAEAAAAAASYEKWTGVLLSAGSCSPAHPVAKGIKTEAAYLVSDAARYCREQAAAAASQATEWRITAESMTEAKIYANNRARQAGKAAMDNARASVLLMDVRVGAIAATGWFIALLLASILQMAVQRWQRSF